MRHGSPRGHGKVLLVGFDMDGTLLEHESSWVAIHKWFGTVDAGEASLKLYSDGKIDYREFMRRDIASWPKGVKRDEIVRVLSGYEVRSDARATVAELRRRGISTAIVSSGIDLLADMVAKELRMDSFVANGFRFDKGGRILGEGVGRVDPTRKDIAYKRLLRRLGVPRERTIAVGDTVYDLAFLKSAGKGFMLSHTTRVEDPQVIQIDRLTQILDHL